MLTADGPVLLEMQRPPRRPRGPGHPAAARRGPRRRCSSPRRAGRCPADGPGGPAGALPSAAVGDRARGGRLPGRPAHAATRSPGSTRRPRPGRSCSTPGPAGRTSAAYRTNGGRVLAVVGRARTCGRPAPAAERAADADHLGRHAAPPRHRAASRLPASPAPRGAGDDPALHAPRDGRGLVRAGPLRADARGRDRRLPRARSGAASSRPRPSPRIEARARVDVDRIAEIEQTTDHDVIAFVSPGRRDRRPGGPLPAPRPDQQRRRGHGARAPAPRRRGAAPRGLPTGSSRPSSPARAAEADTLMMGRTHSVHAEPTTFGLKLRRLGVRGRPRPGAPRRGHRRDRHRQDRGAGRARTATSRRTSRPRCSRELGPARGPGEHPDRPARPPRGVPRRDRDPRRVARALRHRDPQPPAHRDRRGHGAVQGAARRAPRRCPTSATRSCRSGSPGWRGCCAAMPQTAFENQPLWHERDISHSSAERVILPDATILLDYMLVKMTGPRRGAGRAAGADAREHRARPRAPRVVARPAGAGRARAACRARTPTRSSSAARCGRPTSGVPLRGLLATDPAVAQQAVARATSTRCFDDARGPAPRAGGHRAGSTRSRRRSKPDAAR